MPWAASLSACTVQIILICQICSAHDRSFDYIFQLNATSEFLPQNVYKVNTLTEIESPTNLPKKWIMGRVSRKHNAIPNMLLRKNHIFRDEAPTPEFDSSFERNIKHYSIPSLASLNLHDTVSKKRALNFLFTKFVTNNIPHIQTTTASDIEFYYLNENENDIKQKTKITDVPKYMTHNDCLCKSTSKIDTVTYPPLQTNEPVYLLSKSYTANDNDKAREKAPRNFGRAYTPTNTPQKNTLETNSQSMLHILHRVERDDSSAVKKYTPLSTQNDRVKFFEQYDSLTEVLKNSTEEYTNRNNGYLAKKDKILIEENINDDYGWNIDQMTTKYPHVKKHGIVARDITENVPKPINNDMNNKNIISSLIENTNINYTKEKQSYRMEKITTNSIYIENGAYQNFMVWDKYPFTAVYVYEQFRVHCDAAAINPYWLLASAACLSRHREDPLGEDRSAFVAYCGDNWWNPERINYVKSTHIHPKFHPRDTIRRHVYNVGVIQVVTSMANSCQNWAPVTIMSHQYVTNSDDSIGLAVGWGLDRYDTSYSTSDLPKRSMAVYKGLIYSNKCPGNAGYSLTKLLGPEATNNVYCLTLPLYDGEVNDPIHGGLLLVGGKLVALYLQEERRRFGEQSAQYTGIWKLLPWVLETAKEPEHIDLFD